MRQCVLFAGDIELDQVSPTVARQFNVHLQARGLRLTSIRTAGRVLRAWLNFYARDGLLDASPMKTIRLPQLPRPAPDAFTPDELRALLAAADTDAEDPIRARAILLCLLDTGYRLGKFA